MKNFVFIHIPKCGGTTIRKNLGGIYHEHLCYDKSYKRYTRRGVNKFTEETNGRVPKKFKSEYKVVTGHFTTHKWKHLGWPIVTMIRDPIERVISQYSAMNLWMPKEKARKLKEKWNIRNFALDTSNQILAMLGRDLDLFLFVGIQEMYERSIGRMEEILQIRFPVAMGMHNKTRRKIEVTKADRRYIESVNREDRELYKEAVRRFISK